MVDILRMNDTSNILQVCHMSRENCELKKIINQQSNEIGKILQEKRDLQEQYDMLLHSIDLHSIPLISVYENTSNIEPIVNTSNINQVI